ncbi:glycoside hydrolase [Thozetella sp. PMI_491]|nr:glycoside hydrolase [Thozetella sp. PMI_491]
MRLNAPAVVASLASTALAAADVAFAPADVNFIPQIAHCPQACPDGFNSSSWIVYHTLRDLRWCKKPMLLNLNLYNPVDDPNMHVSIQACVPSTAGSVRRRDDAPTFANATVPSNSTGLPSNTNDASEVLSQIQTHIQTADACKRAFTMAYSNGTVAGVYVGKNILNANDLVTKALASINSQSLTNQTLTQICGSGRNADYVFGVVVDTSSSALANVQSVLKSWNSGKCVSGAYESSSSDISVQETALNAGLVTAADVQKGNLVRRSDCTAIQVIGGDICDTLASKCGISRSDFNKYNTATDAWCNGLQAGQWVCCSSGTLPDMKPKPNDDGSCHVYYVAEGDNCSKIGAANSLTNDDIEGFNKKTWGWMGCETLYANMNICLSEGDPPFPAPVEGTICGPQVTGTQKPTNGTDYALLNPCPLNACCDVWGQCGVTDEFCTAEDGPAGAPGTAPKGHNGCISNCGTDITNNDAGPASEIKLAYFEAWNMDRPCLNMDVSQVEGYTHIHFAFGNITHDFQVDVSGVQDQFNDFVATATGRKILSFGGWSFSTSQDSFPIFGQGVTSANRVTFAQNVVNFINLYGLDGVDFDWEYPGATDIDGVTSNKDDGKNYLQFLRTLRTLLPDGKTMSIAAPASYWYLRGFPIKDMSDILDYIVYMTYDLHGQWDYDNKFANPGCDMGNCLRSHVNITETLNALAMITKAGVPSNKIVVGVSSYGRSFGMTDPSCTGPECTFVGPESGASKGECTGTAGYISNAEMANLAKKRDTQSYYDRRSGSDILIYDGNWVAYMSDDTKATRMSLYSGYNFAGSTDWAVDLQKEVTPATNPIANCEDWRKKTCDDPLMSNADQNQTARWIGLGADCALTETLAHWKSNPGTFSFSNAASNYLHGRGSFECGKIQDHSNCDTTQTCDESHSLFPGPTLLLNSFTNLYELHANAYSGIQAAHDDIQDEIGTLVSKFAPSLVEPDALKIALDIFGMAYALFAAPMWNSVLKGISFFKSNGNTLGTLKDSVNGIVSNSLTLIKDSSAAGQAITTQDNVQATLGQLVTYIKNVMEESNEKMFSGNDDDVNTLKSLINLGQFVEPGPGLSNEEYETLLTYNLYATLIPRTWRLAPDPYYPFILTTGAACGTTNPLPDYVDDGEGNTAWACAEDGLLYYIMGAPGDDPFYCYDSGDGQGVGPCYTDTFHPPPGVETLDGKNWGGVTREDLVVGAVNSWIHNGKKNGWTQADVTNPDTISAVYDTGVRTPGFIPIPVCSADEAMGNWGNVKKSDRWDIYPCNKV